MNKEKADNREGKNQDLGNIWIHVQTNVSNDKIRAVFEKKRRKTEYLGRS